MRNRHLFSLVFFLSLSFLLQEPMERLLSVISCIYRNLRLSFNNQQFSILIGQPTRYYTTCLVIYHLIYFPAVPRRPLSKLQRLQCSTSTRSWGQAHRTNHSIEPRRKGDNSSGPIMKLLKHFWYPFPILPHTGLQ